MRMFHRLEPARRPESRTLRRPPPKRLGARRQGRLRLIVIQALVFSLFATLFVRLYYLQVVGGEQYHAQAAYQSVREIVVQPQRGLIVDDKGRPLVANRTLVGGLGRPHHARQDDRARAAHRLARWAPSWASGPAGSGPAWSPAATPAASRHLLERLALPAGPGRHRRPRRRCPADPRAAGGLPRVLAEQQTVRAYPQPYGINLAHVLGYLSPITEDEYDAAEARRPVGQRRLVGRPRRRREAVRRVAARHARLPAGRGRLDGPGARRRQRSRASPATPWSPRSTPRSRVVEQQLAETIKTARADHRTPVTGRNYAADSGAAVVLEAKTGRVVAMASQPTYDPGSGSAASARSSSARLYSEKAGTPLLSRHPGAVRPGLDVEAVHDRRGAHQRLHHRHPAQLLLVGLPGRQPGVQELRVRRLRLHRLRQGARGLVQHLLLPGRLRLLAAATAPTSTTSTPRTRWSRRPRPSASAARPASTCPARRRAGSPTGLEARLLRVA